MPGTRTWLPWSDCKSESVWATPLHGRVLVRQRSGAAGDGVGPAGQSGPDAAAIFLAYPRAARARRALQPEAARELEPGRASREAAPLRASAARAAAAAAAASYHLLCSAPVPERPDCGPPGARAKVWPTHEGLPVPADLPGHHAPASPGRAFNPHPRPGPRACARRRAWSGSGSGGEASATARSAVEDVPRAAARFYCSDRLMLQLPGHDMRSSHSRCCSSSPPPSCLRVFRWSWRPDPPVPPANRPPVPVALRNLPSPQVLLDLQLCRSPCPGTRPLFTSRLSTLRHLPGTLLSQPLLGRHLPCALSESALRLGRRVSPLSSVLPGPPSFLPDSCPLPMDHHLSWSPPSLPAASSLPPSYPPSHQHSATGWPGTTRPPRVSPGHLHHLFHKLPQASAAPVPASGLSLGTSFLFRPTQTISVSIMDDFLNVFLGLLASAI